MERPTDGAESRPEAAGVQAEWLEGDGPATVTGPADDYQVEWETART